MGITIREVLEAPFFADFQVIAGHGGLDNQIQGVTVLDAPDGVEWSRGRELVLTSGYSLRADTEPLKRQLRMLGAKTFAGFVIKKGRYFDEIPSDIFRLFDEYAIPLMLMPAAHPWMDVMNQINVLVMNKNIRRFKLSDFESPALPNLEFKDRKISSILSAVEHEMSFPAYLYDLCTGKNYAQTGFFKAQYAGYQLKPTDFWEPSFSYSKQVLCETLQIARYRIMPRDSSSPVPFSWITVPIRVRGEVKAYFVVVESFDLIDYFDQSAIRMAVLILESLYEQMDLAESVGDHGFENFVLFALQEPGVTQETLALKASHYHLKLSESHFCILLQQTGASLLDSHALLKQVIHRHLDAQRCRIALLSDQDCLILFRAEDGDGAAFLPKALDDLVSHLQIELPNSSFYCGYSEREGCLCDILQLYRRCGQAVRVGAMLYPERRTISYESLGVFAWLDIREDEIAQLTKPLEPLLKSDKRQELLTTLRTYLQSNMNFSATAEKLFLHINTVRKRIDQIDTLLGLDWNDPVVRLQINTALQLLDLR